MPHALRSIGMIVPLHLLAAWGLWQIWNHAKMRYSGNAPIINVLSGLLLLGNLVSTEITYFILWGHNPQTKLYFSSGGIVLPKQ